MTQLQYLNDYAVRVLRYRQAHPQHLQSSAGWLDGFVSGISHFPPKADSQ